MIRMLKCLAADGNAGDDEKSVEDNIHVGNLNGEVPSLFLPSKVKTCYFKKKKKNNSLSYSGYRTYWSIGWVVLSGQKFVEPQEKRGQQTGTPNDYIELDLPVMPST